MIKSPSSFPSVNTQNLKISSQDMNQDTHLDVHFNAIRLKFDHLNQELDEARNERDEYKRNCVVCFRHLLVDN